MTIQLDEHFVGLWVFELKGIAGDFMAGMRSEDGETFSIDSRMRTFVDDKVFDSKDPKHWIHAEGKFSSAEEAIESFRQNVEKMYDIMGQGGVDEILMDDRGVNGVMEEMKQRDCFHMQEQKLQ